MNNLSTLIRQMGDKENYIGNIVNKSFLILDEIQESFFPLLEKSIFSVNSSENVDKSKISKLEFIIHQRIKHVENNCNQLEHIFSELANIPSDKSNVDLWNYRINQLRGEQKRILSAFKGIQHKRLERERVEKEQEEFLTRRFTASTTNDHVNQNIFSENCVVDLNNEVVENEKSSVNKITVLTLNKLRNQQPLVKRVRTRYLDFSTDFFGMTKMFLKYSCVDWVILLAFVFVFFMGIFCFIIWKTAPPQL